MSLETKFYKILLWKAYFDKGFSLLSYLKYILVIVGFGAVFQGVSLWIILEVGFAYAIICLLLGRLWFGLKLINIEIEINNKVNPFVQEMRERFK